MAAKISKKALCIIISVVLVVGALGIGLIIGLNHTPRSSVLKIYNWEDYIEESLIKDFEKYYREATGDKKFKVEYRTFTDNEELYTKIKSQKADYDLAFPSEYMVEKLRDDKDGSLLKPIDMTKIANRDELDDNILARTAEITAVAGETDKVWAIPYILGTLGIMYDTDVIAAMEPDTKISVAEFEAMLDEYGWGVLFGEGESKAYKDHITMKKSARDTIGIAMLYSQKDKMKNDPEGYFNDLGKILNMDDPYTLQDAEKVLREQVKVMNPKYENDDGKKSFQDENNRQFAYGLYWSCDVGLVMYEDDNHIRENIKYYTPEGTNLWTDNFVMPKYGKNDAAAYAFINFMLDPENAKANIEYVGSTMAVTTAIQDLQDEWAEEGNDWMDNYIQTVFPTEETIAHTAVMHNFDPAQESKVNDLMISIMNDSAQNNENDGVNWLAIVLAIVVAAALIGGLVYYLTHRRRAR